MKKLLHIAANGMSRCMEPETFRQALGAFGELTVVQNGASLTKEQIAQHVREANVYLAGWGSVALPKELAGDPGKLEYVCGITGTMREMVPVELVDAGIPLTNWGDTPAGPVAESAVALLLAAMKDLHHHIRVIHDGGWRISNEGHGGSLNGLNVGVYGCGAIGRRFVEMIRPFGPVVRVYDPYLEELPAGMQRVDTLEELFEESQAIVIHAGLTPETRKSVTAELLAKLPDHAVVVNTARGGIIDQPALFKELESGRLRAALDVLDDGDTLPPAHPARRWDNLILTSHQAEMVWPRPPNHLAPMHRVCLDNLKRFTEGRPLRFVMDPVRYRRST
jgi:phosphoglycerate dehydrogenase-like enzyme